MANPEDGRPQATLSLSETARYVPWRLARAQAPESCRWECRDGRWVSLTIAHHSAMTKVIVADWSGRRELVDHYEEALALAKTWRD
jgi:hypothetical protein